MIGGVSLFKNVAGMKSILTALSMNFQRGFFFTPITTCVSS